MTDHNARRWRHAVHQAVEATTDQVIATHARRARHTNIPDGHPSRTLGDGGSRSVTLLTGVEAVANQLGFPATGAGVDQTGTVPEDRIRGLLNRWAVGWWCMAARARYITNPDARPVNPDNYHGPTMCEQAGDWRDLVAGLLAQWPESRIAAADVWHASQWRRLARDADNVLLSANRIRHAADSVSGRRWTSGGTCQCCERDVPGTPDDRIVSGYCEACRSAWRRAGQPADRSGFEHRRRESLTERVG